MPCYRHPQYFNNMIQLKYLRDKKVKISTHKFKSQPLPNSIGTGFQILDFKFKFSYFRKPSEYQSDIHC